MVSSALTLRAYRSLKSLLDSCLVKCYTVEVRKQKKGLFLYHRDKKGRFAPKVVKLEQEEFSPVKRFYFGYGSNLDIFQMKRRCPDCEPVVSAKLPGYLLTFSGVLTIARDDEAYVLGGIYLVSDEDEGALDMYEGFPHLYVKRYTHVTIAGMRQEIFYYVMPEDSYHVSPPGQSYYNVCEQGYRDWGLDVAELEAARKRSWKARKSFYDWKSLSYRKQLTTSIGEELMPI